MSEGPEPSAPESRRRRDAPRWSRGMTAATAVLVAVILTLGGVAVFLRWSPQTGPLPSPSASETPAVDRPLALDAGGDHTCLLTSAGEARCWGDNDAGEVGTGSTSLSVRRPVSVLESGDGNTSLSSGSDGTCVVTDAGGVRCWGVRGSDQNGPGPTDEAAVSAEASAVSVGAYHQCAASGSGGVLCWGRNDEGQLGDGTTRTPSDGGSSAPPVDSVEVKGLADITALATGMAHTCALTRTGSVLCWGSNAWGQLGDGTDEDHAVPAAVTGLASGVTAIEAGSLHTCAVKDTGGVVCWGAGSDGQLGDGRAMRSSVPVEVVALSAPAVSVTAGNAHTCAVTGDGAVTCWGGNSNGQLGDGTTAGSAVPVGIAMPGEAWAVTAGEFHTCAATSGGVLCWGSNDSGQLGDGTRTGSSEPVRVANPAPPALVRDTRPIHLIYLHTDGTVTKGEDAESIRKRSVLGRRVRSGDQAVLDAIRHGFTGATGGRMAPGGVTVTVVPGQLSLVGRCIDRYDPSPNSVELAARPHQVDGAINVIVVDALDCPDPDGIEYAGYDPLDGMPVVLWRGLTSVTSLVHIVLHEFGHDAGLGHAGITVCQDPVRLQICEASGPTDDSSSLMSYTNFAEVFSAPELRAMQLLMADESVVIVPGQTLPGRIELKDTSEPGHKLLVLEPALENETLYISWVDGALESRQMFAMSGASGYTSRFARESTVRSMKVFENDDVTVTFVGTDAEGDAILDIQPGPYATATGTPAATEATASDGEDTSPG